MEKSKRERERERERVKEREMGNQMVPKRSHGANFGEGEDQAQSSQSVGR